MAEDKANGLTKKHSQPHCAQNELPLVSVVIPCYNAEKYVEQLHSKGLDKAYTMVNNRMVRVIYGNYASETDAYNDLQKIRSNDEFEQAWILKKKN